MNSLRVVTFNIRGDTANDGPRAWANRRALVVQTLRDHDPDLLGVQEATTRHWNEIAAALSGWTPFGRTERNPVDTDADVPGAFVRSRRFEVLESGVFWLSDTPDAPDTITWPNDCGARRCCWARLEDRTVDRTLVFACTHVDTNAAAWLPSARVLHGKLDQLAAGAPIVLVGDFNCAAGSAMHTYLRTNGHFRDAWNEAGHSDEGIITFNGFVPHTRLPIDSRHLDRWLEQTSTPVAMFGHYPSHIRAHRNYRIDWILLRGAIRCVSAANDYRNDRGRLPSDHYPVIARVEWDEAEPSHEVSTQTPAIIRPQDSRSAKNSSQ